MAGDLVTFVWMVVLIVPLWNWNVVGSAGNKCAASVLIVPLWNWNKVNSGRYSSLARVLIVPLWNWNYVKHAGSDTKLDGSNRTFMELKCRRVNRKQVSSLVLIVPLWNWNLTETTVSVVQSSSNRTFMELKYFRLHYQVRCVYGF